MRAGGKGHFLIPSCTVDDLKEAREAVRRVLGVPRLIGNGMLKARRNGIEVWQRGSLRGVIEKKTEQREG